MDLLRLFDETISSTCIGSFDPRQAAAGKAAALTLPVESEIASARPRGTLVQRPIQAINAKTGS
jgi:hypothetical protein